MADFQRLADVETVAAVNDEDTVLIEQGGEVKRAPKSEIVPENKGSGTVIIELVRMGRYVEDTRMDGYTVAQVSELLNSGNLVVFHEQANDKYYYPAGRVSGGIIAGCVDWNGSGNPFIGAIKIKDDSYSYGVYHPPVN